MDRYFQCELFLPRSREKLFQFFSEARNLEIITPSFLHFEILPPVPDSIVEGTLIDYRIHLHGFPIRWRTKITVWEPPVRFVDEQLAGPYRKWIHEHTFIEENGGTRCLDHITYSAPGGRWIDCLIVKPDLVKIFDFRREQLLRLFA
ncbi:MAG: SRPBCC family protein [Verrucomicrobiota bacterium]|nr:SRPBCC family protein [Verrucomicrobiota bacterium]